jgi:predicted transcriptional regulator of viral defense system
MKYTDFKRAVTGPLFTRQDIRLRGLKLFGYQLSLWQKQGHIIKLKNGIYLFADSLGRVAPEEITGLLYSPCYISLEKALSHYGLIPEMVSAITLVTPKATRRFSNRLGNFIYRQIKPSLFFGYRETKGAAAPYLLAEPEKALLDYLYLNKYKSVVDLESLRLNKKTLKELFRPKLFKQYLAVYQNNALNKLCAAYGLVK